MAEKEQVKPLASAPFRSDLNEEELSMQFNFHQRNYLKCCGCFTTLLLIPAVVLLILSFTAFHIHHPQITMNSITVQQLHQDENQTLRDSDIKMSLVVDISVKNPNVASFKYSDAVTRVYQEGTVVGEARNPSGKIKAKSKVLLNVSIDVSVRRTGGMMKMGINTRIDGRVKIMGVIKKSVVPKMNCSMRFDVLTKAFQEERCGQNVMI